MPGPGDFPAPPRIIPAGRESLYQRADEADAEVRRLTALYEAADRRAERLNWIYPAYHPVVRDADAETERINLEVDWAEAVAERVHQERTAGLSGWIDESEYLPVCETCNGSGIEPGCRPHGDVRDACGTCHGWGRVNDGRPCPPVWHDGSDGRPAGWVNPATGQPAPCPPGCSVLDHGHGTGMRLYDGEYPGDLSGGTTTGGTVSNAIGQIQAQVLDVADSLEQVGLDLSVHEENLQKTSQAIGESLGESHQQDVADLQAEVAQAIEALGGCAETVGQSAQQARDIEAQL